MVKFLVLATQRSGTVFLESILNSHPDIYCTGERLLYNNVNSFIDFWDKKVKEDKINLTPKYSSKVLYNFMDEYFNARTEKAVGFDVKYNQYFTIANMHTVLQKHDIRIIHLIRENILKTLISLRLNVMQRELNRKSHTKEKVKAVKIRLETGNKLIKELNRRDEQIQYFKQLLSSYFPYLELHYEKFFPENQGEAQTIRPEILSSITEFLEVNLGENKMSTPYRKTNPVGLRDLLENYDEVYKTLISTRFAHLLNEDNPADDYENRINQGEKLFSENRIQEALNFFHKMLEDYSDNARLCNNIAVCYWQLHDDRKAEEFIKHAIRIEPENPQYKQNLQDMKL